MISNLEEFMFTVTLKEKMIESFTNVTHSGPAASPPCATTKLKNTKTIGAETFADAIVPVSSASASKFTDLKNKHIIYPEKEDTLFWCMYIAMHGHDEYMMIDKRYGNIELSEKQNMITAIRERPKQLKQSNFKVTNVMIQEILSDLMIHKQTSLTTLIAMVTFYKRPVYILFKNMYLYFSDTTIMDDHVSAGGCPIVLYRNGDGEYGVCLSTPEEITEIIENVKSTHFQLEHYEKPLKSQSLYKVNELHDVANKMGLTEDVSKMKKGDLYAKLNDLCSW